MDEKMLTLECRFAEDETYKPTRDGIQLWLENNSGLPEEYIEKIKQVKCDAENFNGFEVIFDESVNCLIALREMENSVEDGRKYGITVKHPKVNFEILRLLANDNIFTRNEVVEAVKSYGEIIEIRDAIWHDNSREVKIPTGDVDVYMLTKKQSPEFLVVGGETFRTRHLFYNLYADEIMRALWNNLKINMDIDYTYKTFKMTDRQGGCGLVCRFLQDCDELPNHKDVYEWLTKESGLCEEYLLRIVAFKKICNSEYEIIFDESVNCLFALVEMKSREVCDSYDVGFKIEINCIKGKFTNITLISENPEDILLRKDAEKVLKPYGPIIDFKRINVSEDFDDLGIITFDVECKMFLINELPDKLEVNDIKVDVEEEDCDQDDLEEETLRKIWDQLKSYE